MMSKKASEKLLADLLGVLDTYAKAKAVINAAMVEAVTSNHRSLYHVLKVSTINAQQQMGEDIFQVANKFDRNLGGEAFYYHVRDAIKLADQLSNLYDGYGNPWNIGGLYSSNGLPKLELGNPLLIALNQWSDFDDSE